MTNRSSTLRRNCHPEIRSFVQLLLDVPWPPPCALVEFGKVLRLDASTDCPPGAAIAVASRAFRAIFSASAKKGVPSAAELTSILESKVCLAQDSCTPTVPRDARSASDLDAPVSIIPLPRLRTACSRVLPAILNLSPSVEGIFYSEHHRPPPHDPAAPGPHAPCRLVSLFSFSLSLSLSLPPPPLNRRHPGPRHPARPRSAPRPAPASPLPRPRYSAQTHLPPRRPQPPPRRSTTALDIDEIGASSRSVTVSRASTA